MELIRMQKNKNKKEEKQMKLLEAIKSRKSIRAYKSDPVPKAILIELLEAANLDHYIRI